MKLTQEQKDKIKEVWGDWESIHHVRDNLMREALMNLDPEFMEDIDKALEDATLWFA